MMSFYNVYTLLALRIICNVLIVYADVSDSNTTLLGETTETIVVHSGLEVTSAPYAGINETGAKVFSVGSVWGAGGSAATIQTPHQAEPGFVHSKGRLYPKLELSSSNDSVLNENHIRQIKEKFKSYQDIKSDFDALNLTIKTDLEIMDDLLRELEQGLADETRYLTIFEDLSYLLHQVDNGEYLVKKGGLQLLQPFLFNESALIQKAVLSCLSAAMQGNAVVKVSVLQSGLFDALCSVLSDSSAPSTPSSEESIKVLSAGLTALSTLLRDFPSAQRYFFSRGNESHPGVSGFDFLTKLFNYASLFPQYKLPANLGVRIVVLLSDIALERVNALQQSIKEPNAKSSKLWELYSQFPFEPSLVQSGWCTRACEFLLAEMEAFVNEDVNAAVNHGQLEKVLFALHHLTPVCGHQFANTSRTSQVLTSLEQRYFELSFVKEGEHDLYFTDLHKLIVDVRRTLQRTLISTRAFDEL